MVVKLLTRLWRREILSRYQDWGRKYEGLIIDCDSDPRPDDISWVTSVIMAAWLAAGPPFAISAVLDLRLVLYYMDFVMVLRLLIEVGPKKWHGPCFTRSGVLFVASQCFYRMFQILGTPLAHPQLFVSSNISTTIYATKQKHAWLTFWLPYSAIWRRVDL